MDSPVDWGYRTVPQSELLGRRIFLSRGKCLGGTSSINYMEYMRGIRGDYDHWAQLGNRGWSYDDVLPLFIRSESNERFRDRYHGTDGPLIVSDHKDRSRLTECFMAAAKEVGLPFTDDVNGAQQEGYGHFQATIGRTGRCSSAVAFLHPAMTRKPDGRHQRAHDAHPHRKGPSDRYRVSEQRTPGTRACRKRGRSLRRRDQQPPTPAALGGRTGR